MFYRGLGQRRKSDFVPLEGVRFRHREMETDAVLNMPFPLSDTEGKTSDEEE